MQGHTALTCYRRFIDVSGQRSLPAQSTQRLPTTPHANVAFQQPQDDIHNAPFTNVWFPDTGANAHATPHVDGLDNVEPYTGTENLRVDDGSGLQISNTGSIYLAPSKLRSLSLNNILHVPKLRASLLYVHKFTNDNNVYFEFHPTHFLVKDRTTHQVLLSGPSTGGMYSLTTSSPVAFMSARASPQTWHNRLSHPHLRVLRQVISRCPVNGSFRAFNKLCTACQLGKSARFPLSRVERSSQSVLELVYTDIWGLPRSGQLMVFGILYYLSMTIHVTFGTTQ